MFVYIKSGLTFSNPTPCMITMTHRFHALETRALSSVLSPLSSPTRKLDLEFSIGFPVMLEHFGGLDFGR
ncbi:hypothetical protein Sjap_000646 [Stephania japonica]|uniref:Uncharacterized protein n=1 Tax=Stephania japonica TaxID=461633 RepID=A0AAP0KIG5_9MAGN